MFNYPDYANNRISVLVQDQLPEYVRNNYPMFQAFMEAYYEYLEQQGKLQFSLNEIPNYLNIDYLVENNVTEFVELYRQMYMTKIPTTVLADKAKLLKHIRTFYNARGTEKSFKFLFRALFNEDVNLFNTGSQILKASDGKWYQPYVLRIVSSNNIALWVNTQVFGQQSFASAVVETAYVNPLPTITYQELTLSNLTKTFLPNETITANTGTQTLYGMVLGIIPSITVTSPGATYNVGDVVPIIGGGGANANAVISSVGGGSLTDVGVAYGGSGYEVSPEWAINVSGNNITGVNAIIFAVDTSSTASPNSFAIIDDIITPSLNITLNSIFTNFTTANITANSRIIDAAKYINYNNCGPIVLTHIVSGGVGLSGPPTIKVNQPTGLGNSNTFIAALGAIGRFTIQNGGTGYASGDDVVINNITARGWGAAGNVATVNGTGAITSVIASLPSISGFGSVVNASNVVTGNGTSFTKQLIANNNPSIPGSGTYIVINSETHRVVNIANDTSLTVDANYTKRATNQIIRLAGYMPGGYGYTPKDIPNGVSISVRSFGGGSGAKIVPEGLLGQDAVLTPVGSLYGQVETITMVDFGDHYSSQPTIDLTHLGNGLATAVANPIFGIFQYPGYFLNEDGMLSSRRYLQDPYTYNNYSYKIISQAVVSAYYNLVYDILNPAGMNMLGVTELPIGTNKRDISANGSVTITTNLPLISINFVLDVSRLD